MRTQIFSVSGLGLAVAVGLFFAAVGLQAETRAETQALPLEVSSTLPRPVDVPPALKVEKQMPVKSDKAEVTPLPTTDTRPVNDGATRVKILPAPRQKVKDAVEAERGEIRAEVKNIRQDAATGVKEAAEAARTDVQILRQSVKNAAEEARQQVRESVKTLREEGSAAREEIQKAALQKREALRQELEEKATAVKAAIEVRREEFKTEVAARKEEVKEKIAEKKADLTARLQTIRDEKKKEVVLKVDENLDKINARQVESFSGTLNKLEDILQKVITRTDKAEAAGRDVQVVRNVVSNAQALLSSVRDRVAAQAAKTYPIEVTTEVTLRAAVESARQTLKNDLTAVRDSIKTVHEAVRSAVTALAKVQSVNSLEETGTGAQSTAPAPAGGTAEETTAESSGN